MDRRYCLFPTGIGAVGIVWTPRGIAGVQIPARDEAATRRTLLRRFPGTVEGEPGGVIREAVADIRSLLAGERTDLSRLPLDLGSVSAFERRVYDAALMIPAGETRTYGEIAALMGETTAAARAVGVALGRNPIPIIVPCHRVLAADGRSGGFSAPGGVLTKLKLLALEDAAPGGQPDLFGLAPG
jgi:methylated-DNA-[protein]-cysteine S-methyltransferase